MNSTLFLGRRRDSVEILLKTRIVYSSARELSSLKFTNPLSQSSSWRRSSQIAVGPEHDRFAPLDAATTMATLTVRDMPSEMEDKILADCHRLNGGGVRELLMLRTVNKAFRRNVDQFVLTITPTIINGGFDFVRGLRAQDKKADLMQLMEIVVNWIALGCLSFVRVAEMRGESKSKVERSAHSFTRRPTHSTTTPGRFLAQDVK